VVTAPRTAKATILDDNTADVAIAAEIAGYSVDDTANADSVDRANVTVLNKFGEVAAVLSDVGYSGSGIVGFGAFDRRYADPKEEAIFKILIRNRGGYSDPIYLQGVTRTTSLPTVKLRANCPLELVATPTSETTVSLSWQFGSNVTVFKRQRGTSTWVSHQTGVSSAAPFLITGLSELTWYEFKVSAGSGNDSNIAMVQTKQVGSAAPSFPSPSGLAGSPDGTNPTTQINLTWARNATTNDGVEVYKNGSLLTTLGAAVTSYSATSLTAGTSYVFKVRNKWDSGPTFSNYSNETTVSTQTSGGSSSAPSGLSATNISIQDSYEAALDWTNNGAGGTISVERKLAGGSYSTIVSGLASSTTSYEDGTVTPGSSGRSYTYRVKNSAVADYSNEDTVFIELYQGGDPYCVTMETLVLTVNAASGEREWVAAGDLQVRDIVVTVNTLTGLVNKAYIRGFRDDVTDSIYTMTATTGEVVTSSGSHPYCRMGDRDGRAVSRLMEGDPLLRIADINSSIVEETAVESVEVVAVETPVAVRSIVLNVLNHTFITAGLVSHNLKTF
jgi:hypothetical protein